jgi:hypothetical protein
MEMNNRVKQIYCIMMESRFHKSFAYGIETLLFAGVSLKNYPLIAERLLDELCHG